jgi:hypothetical protein
MMTIVNPLLDPAQKAPVEYIPVEPPLRPDEDEKTDYSYDPDDEWSMMHLDEKMEENY